ncbi:hypothetical protein FACS189431_2360 [Alphaproteobacteria bacterium]|nr:hypothetical protein FACS189431_2360 [Alphaproteobacteria bacterium]
MIKLFLTAFSVSLVAVLGLFSFITAPSVYADACTGSSFLGFPNWYRGLQCSGDAGNGTYHVDMSATPIPTFIWTVVLNVIEILLIVIGILAVVMILVSAFRYLTNGGSEEKIRSAKTSLMQAIVGLVIALMASTIISFIVGGLSNGW